MKIDDWEKEATESLLRCDIHMPDRWEHRFLTLIDLIRRKDEALSRYARNFHEDFINSTETHKPGHAAREALALTEELK